MVATHSETHRTVFTTFLSVIIGLLLALFIGFGIATFYPAPHVPTYPTQFSSPASPSAAEKSSQDTYDREYKTFQEQTKAYAKKVSLYIFLAALLVLILAVGVLNKVYIVGEGVMLGGLFTLLYGLIMSFQSDDPKYSFGAITLALVVVIGLTYIQFIKPLKSSK